MKTFPIALQPYTVRDELASDYFGTLSRIAEIGYQGVELGPPPAGTSIDTLKQHLERIGLQVIGAHAGLAQLTDGFEELAAYLHEVGGKYVAISYRFGSRQEVLEAAQQFEQIGRRCHEAGLQFLYHNHNWEFTRFDGQYALDILLEAASPHLLQMELDTYWVQRGGADPVAYLRKLHGRCPLLHIKDMEPGEEQFFAEIGEGTLDWGAILREAEAAGTEWLVVEQDRCRRPVFESIAISYRNLKAIGAI
jgi:sugar phosphate isomerase/epimerase